MIVFGGLWLLLDWCMGSAARLVWWCCDVCCFALRLRL